MKVNQSGNAPIQGRESSESTRSGRAVSAKGAREAPSTEQTKETGAKLQISQKGKHAAKANAVATGAPDIREERVADLKNRIANGTYEVDRDALADRMVEEHLRSPGIG